MKLTIIINGSGGVGKDTLCRIAAKQYKVRNISSITPIKEIATLCGWGGEKTDKARRFLADLKALTVGYNDFPSKWLMKEYEDFLTTDEEILFIHIREPEEIAKFVGLTNGAAKTLLVRGGSRMSGRTTAYGNHADDDVEQYAYDYYFNNDKPLSAIEPIFLRFIASVMRIADKQDS